MIAYRIDVLDLATKATSKGSGLSCFLYISLALVTPGIVLGAACTVLIDIFLCGYWLILLRGMTRK